MIAEGYSIFQGLGACLTMLIAPVIGYLVATYFNAQDMLLAPVLHD